jgi:hypothetical protein
MGLHYSFTEIVVTSDSDPTLPPIILPLNASSAEIEAAAALFFQHDTAPDMTGAATEYLEQTLNLPPEQAAEIIQQLYELLKT